MPSQTTSLKDRGTTTDLDLQSILFAQMKVPYKYRSADLRIGRNHHQPVRYRLTHHLKGYLEPCEGAVAMMTVRSRWGRTAKSATHTIFDPFIIIRTIFRTPGWIIKERQLVISQIIFFVILLVLSRWCPKVQRFLNKGEELCPDRVLVGGVVVAV